MNILKFTLFSNINLYFVNLDSESSLAFWKWHSCKSTFSIRFHNEETHQKIEYFNITHNIWGLNWPFLVSSKVIIDNPQISPFVSFSDQCWLIERVGHDEASIHSLLLSANHDGLHLYGPTNTVLWYLGRLNSCYLIWC